VGAGIIPWGCVILDPRPFNEVSTHGKLRAGLVDRAPRDTHYFVASMTDKDMVNFFTSQGYKTWGWHAWNSALNLVEEIKGTDHFFIQGGTCSAMRAVGLMHTLGFRRFICYGFDSCLEGKPEDPDERDENGNPKYFVVEVGDKKFYSTGELIAQSQDIEQLLNKPEMDFYIEFKPGGLGHEIWKAVWKPRFESYREFASTFKSVV